MLDRVWDTLRGALLKGSIGGIASEVLPDYPNGWANVMDVHQMASFAPVNFPILNDDGTPSQISAERWRLNADLRRGVIVARAGPTERTFPFSSLMAVDIGSEKEVRALGKTIGRMALSGVGMALFSRGREGGVGASLLDLSLRGAEHQQMVSGIMVWPNLCVVQFDAKGTEIEQLSQFIPREAFEQDSLHEAEEMLSLVARMKDDGRRSLVEVAIETINLNQQAKSRLEEAENGATFQERDAARQEAKALEYELIRKRYICMALMHAMNVSAQDLLADPSIHGVGAAELLGHDLVDPKLKSEVSSDQAPNNVGVVREEKYSRPGALFVVGGVTLGLAILAFSGVFTSSPKQSTVEIPPPATTVAPQSPADAPGPSNAQEETRVNPEPNDTLATRSDPKPPADADDHDAMPPSPTPNGATPSDQDTANTAKPQTSSPPAKEASRGEDAEPAPSPPQPSPEALKAWADAAIKRMTDNASKMNLNSNLRGSVDLRMLIRGDGVITFITLARPARNGYLNYISQQIVRQSSPLSPPPDGKMHQLVLALSFPIETRYAPQEPGSEPDPSAAGRY